MGCFGNILEENTGMCVYICDLMTSAEMLYRYVAYMYVFCVYTHMHAKILLYNEIVLTRRM